jgi:hypothetical protein
MVNKTLGITMLLCLTLLPLYSFDRSQVLVAAGLGSAFAVILPAALGVGVHFLEKSIHIEHQGIWREDEHVKIELSRLIQTVVAATLSAVTWGTLKGFYDPDFRIAFSMISVYCYGQGRSYYMSRQSKLQHASLSLFPGALGLIAYRRIPDLAPQIELAVKSLLVFVLPHGA